MGRAGTETCPSGRGFANRYVIHEPIDDGYDRDADFSRHPDYPADNRVLYPPPPTQLDPNRPLWRRKHRRAWPAAASAGRCFPGRAVGIVTTGTADSSADARGN